jgi:hypothetical protein
MLTKIAGFPDRADAVPGMAYFRGTGPFATTCGSCTNHGYMRQAASGKLYKVWGCLAYKKLTGRHGPEVARENESCKYYERKKPK